MAAFNQLSDDEKRRQLIALKNRLTKDASQSAAKQTYGPLPAALPDQENRYKPFPLADIQASYFAGRHLLPPNERVGCHSYLEFEVREADLARMESAWNKLVRHHDMLRTIILKNGQQQIQQETPHYNIQCYVFNDHCLDGHLQLVREEMSHKHYGAGEWPLFDVRATVHGDVTTFHVSIDSWITDGPSAFMLFQQWRQLYIGGVEPETISISFRDYMLASRKVEQHPLYKKHLAFWQSKLSTLKGGPALPYCKNSSVKNIAERIRLEYNTDEQAWQNIKSAAQEMEVSPTTLLLTLFVNVLREFSSVNEFAIVLTTTSRLPLHVDVTKLFGPFTSTSIFYAVHDSSASLPNQAKAVQKQLWEDLDHSLVSGIAAMRAVSAGTIAPAIPVVFTSLLNSKKEAGSWLDTQTYGVAQTPQVLLDHQLMEKAGCLHVRWDVAHNYFENDFTRTLFDAFCSSLHVLKKGEPVEDIGAAEFRFPSIDYNSPVPAEPFSLTSLQQSYLAHKLHPDKKPTIVYQEFEVREFDVARFDEAIGKLVCMHPALHTIFTGKGSQYVSPGVCCFVTPLNSLVELPEAEQQAQLDATRMEMSGRFFSIKTWPYFDIRISVVVPGKAIVHIALDMMIADGFSVLLLYSQLFSLYAGEAQEIPEMRLTQSNYVHALDSKKDGALYELSRKYWNGKIKTLHKGPALPLLAGRAHVKLPVRISDYCSEWNILRQKALALNVQPAAILLALYAEVIAAWSNTPVFSIVCVDYEHRRRLVGSEALLGDMTNLCWITSEGKSFTDKVVAANRQLISDQRNSRVSGIEGFRQNASDGKATSLSFPVVFTNCLDLPPTPLPASVTPLTGLSNTPMVLLDLFVYEQAGVLHCNWDYDGAQLSADLARGISTAFHEMAGKLCTDTDFWQQERLVQQADQSFNSNALSLQQRLELLTQWNNTDCDYNRNICLHRLFEEQAERVPENIATVTSESMLTYRELNGRANQMAHFLQKQGVSPNMLVGICMERSHDMIVSVLAIQKAGGAYVPLNVGDPVSRIQSIVETAKIKIIITSLSIYEKMNIDGLRFIFIDGDEGLVRREHAGHAPITNGSANDLAYAIFTSGSTGNPKGVIVKHRPVVNLIEWAQKTFQFTEKDRTLFVSPLSFDLSVFDIFGLLAFGGSIRICTEEERQNAKALSNILLHEPISFWNSAPSALQLLVPFLKLQKDITNDCMRLVFLSGDWIPLTLPGEMKKAFPSAEVISLGGATEAAVWSNYYPVKHINQAWRSIPYGRPIQNARYYILDEDKKPCAIGETGELYIGGECLSEGYINAPQLTAEKFLPDPFHDRSGFRMYRTGDLARFFPDGNIEFLGRADHQVKIRGFRIELGEIDAALQKSGMDEAVTIMREETSGNRMLVAFVVLRAMDKNEEHVKRSLSTLLPDYMIPSRVIFLDAMPITENGKVDRKVLTAETIPSIEARYTKHGQEQDKAKEQENAPSNRKILKELVDNFVRTEVAVILECSEERVEPLSNIGHLGFNSLHYTRLGAELMEKLQSDINPTDFFQHNTVDKIGSFLIDRYEQSLVCYFGQKLKAALNSPSAKNETINKEPAQVAKQTIDFKVFTPVTVRPDTRNEQDVAVIGMYGKMPEADELNEFWRNLAHEKDCIIEIPSDRWDWRAIFGDPQKEDNKTLSNKGGFMRVIDQFDAAFFGISPREAELMDPRQRMLLENVWHSLEDAGYPASQLHGKDIGIFIGATGDEFASLSINKSPRIDNFTLSGISRTMLTNRVSYFFNWSGPSEVIDTACSSSLVAIHNAVNALHNGDCSLAIAGGVNIIIDPKPHICLSKIGMLSPDGKCKTFDASANGYVRGEGIGTVILKPLNKAIEDGDNIYAVIKATSLNHGGKANALTAPNPEAQSKLLVTAYRRAGIDPASVTYIEMHGTGTALGDPIEINALKDAFGKLYWENRTALKAQRTALGSIKTNIGHLESAAGIASFLKAVLAIKHKMIPGAIHLNELNPHIELGGSPFYIARHTIDWKTVSDDEGKALPRRAGVSSFGFGGVNAHIVLEEFIPPVLQKKVVPTLLVLSAKDEMQLKTYAAGLLEHLENNKDTIELADLAYTLQAGREHMEERVSCMVQSIQHCMGALRAFINGSTENLHRGNVKRDRDKIQLLDGSEGKAFIRAVMNERILEKIASLWAWGMEVEWHLLADGNYRRIPLPVYPFKKERHWPAFMESGAKAGASPKKIAASLPGSSYSIVLTGRESFLEDHVINEKKILPGMACVAFVCHAYEQRYGMQPNTLSDITWLHPVLFDEDRPLRLDFSFEVKNEKIQALCTSVGEGEQRTHFMATMSRCALTPEPAVSLDIVKSGNKRSLEACYSLLAGKGICYGKTFRVIKKLWMQNGDAVAHMVGTAPAGIKDAIPFLDGALQTVALQQLITRPDKGLSIPYNIDRIRIYKMLSHNCLVHVKAPLRSGQLEKTDVLLTDEAGEVLISIQGSTARSAPLKDAVNTNQPVHFYTEQWRKAGFISTVPSNFGLQRVLVLNNQALAQQLEKMQTPVINAQHIRDGVAVFNDCGFQLNLNSFLQVKELLLLLAGDAFPGSIIWQMNACTFLGLGVEEMTSTIYLQFFNLCKLLVRSRVLKPLQLIVVYPADHPVRIPVSALSSFGKSLHKENPSLTFKFLEAGASLLQDEAALVERITVVAAAPAMKDSWRCMDTKPGALEFRELIANGAPHPKASLQITSNDICLITGGTGKIGWLLGNHLAEEFRCKVILAGRSISPEQSEALTGLNEKGSQIIYHPCDLGNGSQVQELVSLIEQQYGMLTGVFHCAGTLKDSLLRNKQKEDVERVFAGKLRGALHVHDATQLHSLKFFVLFSSLTAVTGNIGQTDYAYANRFLEEWSDYRNTLAGQKQCSGVTISISWPLWNEGGMQVPEHALAAMKAQTGMEPVNTAAAFGILKQCISAGAGRYIAVSGNRSWIDRLLMPEAIDKEGTGARPLQDAVTVKR
ncbi:hypothetical protein GCM10023189_40280 [Nibrella saemangeumensis]|uniref:Amino acid adenylation domain-containing protein n=1 Tax=Nibrella saemangeumensis TaxID=1084526 RepID=A0ABP8NAY1_9BACT